jgi:uncharacterized membrane protein YdjX (TVP38/TMEM64 family)
MADPQEQQLKNTPAITYQVRLGFIFRWMVMIVLLGVMAVLAMETGDDASQLVLLARNELNTPSNLIYISLIYTLCLATPFMPGIELGLLIMFLFGLPGVIAAYISTVLGLFCAFMIGRLGLREPPEIGPTSRFQRLTTRLRSHPYFALALFLNMPGNWVIGGGGGISLLAGMSSHMTLARFTATVCLAISPVPILVALGLLNLEALLTV